MGYIDLVGVAGGLPATPTTESFPIVDPVPLVLITDWEELRAQLEEIRRTEGFTPLTRNKEDGLLWTPILTDEERRRGLILTSEKAGHSSGQRSGADQGSSSGSTTTSAATDIPQGIVAERRAAFEGGNAGLGEKAAARAKPHNEKIERLPGDGPQWVKLRGNQGWKNTNDGSVWNKDMKHKDHWDVTDGKGKKIREVDFEGRKIWPDGPKNKNKR